MDSQEEAGLKFHSSPKLREFFRTVATATAVSEKSRITALNYAEEESGVVPFVFLRDVYVELGPGDRSPIHHVLAGSSIFLEIPKPREKSEELKARLKKLQELADKKQYNELVHDITKHTQEPEYFSSYKDQLGFGEIFNAISIPGCSSSFVSGTNLTLRNSFLNVIGLHVALTMFTGFAVGFTIFRSLFRDTPVLHAAGGALGMIAGMLLETLLFIVRDAQRETYEARIKRENERTSQASSRKKD